MRIPWHKLLPFYNICVVFFHNLCIHEVYILQLTWRVTYRKCYIPNIFASVKHFKQRREEDIGKGHNVFVSWQILSISANCFFLVDTGPFFAQHALTLTFKWPWPLTINIEKNTKFYDVFWIMNIFYSSNLFWLMAFYEFNIIAMKI